MLLTVFPVVEKQQCIVLMWGKENKWPCGTVEALLFGMDVKKKKLSSLIILCSFSFFLPFLPVPLTAAPSASQEMGYRALPAWGVEEGAGQHSILSGLLWASSVPTKMLNLMRAQITILSCLGLIGLLKICCLLTGRRGREQAQECTEY